MTRARFILLTLLLQLGARSAFAQEAPPPVAHHRLGVDLGLASAVGVAGVGYQFAPVRWARLEGGVGWGATGTQLSFMPKIALGSGACAFVAGVGASLAVGAHQAEPGHGPNPDVIPWLNLDVPGVECRTRSGFSFQATLGLTMALADFHWDAVELGSTVHAGDVLPQGRIGAGW